ncbi:MAG: ATP-binding protein, partial [Candidatus Binatia bacterium]
MVTPLAAMPAARAALARIPFVGRGSELARLAQRLAEAGLARGGLLMLVGEAGIGKTRTAEVFCAAARDAGALTLWGRCDEGGWAPPFEPFRAMLVAYAEQTDCDTLRAALGAGANVLAGLTPYLQRRLPDLPAPLALGPDESRLRLFDAVTQFLLACSAARPVVLVLDDLHWADAGTIALLRYTARYASAHRLLLVGTYRDAAIEMGAPLAEALAALRHDTCFERLALRPLDRGAIADLLAQLGGGVAAEVVAAVDTAGEGNPFFIRELLLDLLETGCIAPRPEGWCFDLSAQRGRVPEGIRDLVRRRLARLSPAARRLLDVAAFLGDGFRFDLAAAVAGLEQGVALAALDEALAAQIVRPGPDGDAYEFVHAMLRQTLYAEPSPSRRLRQHRDIAEALERLAGGSAGDAHAAAIAHQYHRSAALPGAERGVPYAVAASERAAATGAHDEVARQVQIALALLPAGDARRPRLLANLGLALAWARAGEVAVRT